MAKPPKTPDDAQQDAPQDGAGAPAPKKAGGQGGGVLQYIKGATIDKWITRSGATTVRSDRAEPALGPRTTGLPNTDERWEDWYTVQDATALLGTPSRQLRTRQDIYRTWQEMGADPIISTALRLHVTAALGGHESRGEMVFIEPADAIKGNAKMEAMVAELAADIGPLINRAAPEVCFNAVWFGDGYSRVYSEQGVGVRDLYTGELVLPPLVQPFERGNVTAGYGMASGPKIIERLSVAQMARMRMPRLLYVPQDRVTWKLWRTTLKTDKLEDLPVLPSLAGGSFLDGAEKAWLKFAQSWAGLTGQRVRDSVRQTFVTVQQQNMTKGQRKTLVDSIVSALTRTNEYINKIVQSGDVPMTELFHFLPVFAEKQMVQLTERASAGATGSTLTIEDVMMNARFLAGALGLDLSMLGFSDQLAGGLGEGGFFRTSAQTAERSRLVRRACTEWVNHVATIHLLQKHGIEFTGELPWKVEYAGGVSAFETEKARTQADRMNATAVAVQTLSQLKELGLDKAAMENLMTTMMGLDSAQAKLLAASLEAAIKKQAEQQAQQAGGGFGGGFGGGDDGGDGGGLDRQGGVLKTNPAEGDGEPD